MPIFFAAFCKGVSRDCYINPNAFRGSGAGETDNGENQDKAHKGSGVQRNTTSVDHACQDSVNESLVPASSLVLRGSLRVVDHNRLHGAFCRLKLQTNFLNAGNDGTDDVRVLVRGVIHLEVESAIQSGLV